jgi:hypothetical protein
MKNALVLMYAAVLAALALAQPEPAQAREIRPSIPREQGIDLVGRVGWLPWRCSDEPVYNFYHNAIYHEPPAVYRGYAYRTHYRYAAWRVVPRTYVCEGR